MKLFIIPLFAISFFVSCKETPCGRAFSPLGLKNFAAADFDTVIIRKYKKTSDFTIRLDSVLIKSGTYGFQQINNDAVIPFTMGGENEFRSDYDYEVYLPKINRLFRITGIVEEFHSQKDGLFSNKKNYCYNPITSYKVNGLAVPGIQSYFPLFLEK
jgi:hypothetical protein